MAMSENVHPERHRSGRMGWLRAAVLGANDGIISTSSLVLGVAAGAASTSQIAAAGIAGLVAGAMSMAAGEYVSVSSQADAEDAALSLEKRELAESPDAELVELARIYRDRGLREDTAHEVARQLMAHDALDAHRRDELGISDVTSARPVQAALFSGASFTAGAALPLAVILLLPSSALITGVALAAIAALAGLGALGARLGGAPIAPAMIRVVLWGGLAMGVTALIGRLIGSAGVA